MRKKRRIATSVAEDGARHANEHGYHATPMVRESFDGIARAILEVADSLSARLIVCGQRGRGVIRSALLGSVSHELAAHAKHPILIVHEMPLSPDA